MDSLHNLLPKSNSVEETASVDVPWAHVRRVKRLVDDRKKLHCPLPAEIAPWLYLSDEMNARRYSNLRQVGVTHVLSVNSMPSHHAEIMRNDSHIAEIMRNDLRAVDIEHRHVSAKDEEGYDMLQHWGECRDYIEKVRDGGGKVLVHCSAGINRSGIIAAAAYMILERKTVIEVVEHLVQKRGTVLWNQSFQKQLCVLAAEEGLLGEKPEGYSDEPVDPPPSPPKLFGSVFD